MRKRKFSLQQLAQFSFKSLPFRQVVCFCVQHFHWFASIGYCERPLCSAALLHAMYVNLDLEEICVVNMSELTMQTNLTVCAPPPPPAVRFGRIPKREKQRLLDEMQSYMNSLNESAAMEMESAVMRDTPAAPIDGNSKEAIGAISRAYRDIFTSSHNSCPERPAKRANIPVTNNNTYHFSQDASFPQGSSQPISAQTYQSCPVAPASLCPVAPNNNQHAFHHGDNNQHAYPVSTNQSHNQYKNATHQKSNSANESSIQNAANNQNQPSCPWKLAPGAKVLVRT